MSVAVFEAQSDAMHGKFLTFTVCEDTYGIEIQYVIEIIAMQSITLVPELPNYIKGIINLRGTIIPVLDVRMRFCKEQAEYDDRTCIVVVEISGMNIGLIVDAVQEVLDIDDEEMVPPPRNKGEFSNEYIRGLGKKGDQVKLIIDCIKLLGEELIASLEELNK